MTHKKPIFDGRPNRHDDLVAELLEHIDEVTQQSTIIFSERPPTVIVERPTGKGFIDLWIGWKLAACQRHCCGSAWGGTICEVKSNLELWSAGDVIRQLKGYEAVFDKSTRDAINSVINGGRTLEKDECNHITMDQCKPLKNCLAVFVDREMTSSEIALFKHENIVIIEPTWRKA